MPRTTPPKQWERCLARVGQYARCSNYISKQRGDGLCGSHGRTQDSGLKVNYAKQPTESQRKWKNRNNPVLGTPRPITEKPDKAVDNVFDNIKFVAKYGNMIATCRCENQKLETTFSSENNHITNLRFHCPDCGTRWGGATS